MALRILAAPAAVPVAKARPFISRVERGASIRLPLYLSRFSI